MPSRYPLRRAGDISALRLVRKLANQIDGIDLTPYEVGDIVRLPAPEAQLLVAERWAEPLGDSPAEMLEDESEGSDWTETESGARMPRASNAPRK